LEVIGAAAFGEDFVNHDVDMSKNFVVKRVKLQEALCDNFLAGMSLPRKHFFMRMFPDFLRKKIPKKSKGTLRKPGKN